MGRIPVRGTYKNPSAYYGALALCEALRTREGSDLDPPTGGERTYKNPTEDASPAPGGTGLRPSRGKLRARNWVGFGPREGGQIRRRNWRPSRGQLRRIRQFLLYERTYPPEGGERRSPKGIVSSYEKRGGRRTASSPHGSLRPREGRSESIREYVKKIASNQLMHKN